MKQPWATQTNVSLLLTRTPVSSFTKGMGTERMLWLLWHQGSYFNLGVNQQIDARRTPFSAMWPEDRVAG
jgi:hypothetical protein